MHTLKSTPRASRPVRAGLAYLAMCQLALTGPLASVARAEPEQAPRPVTPIRHVIVIVGENRTFDHLFATYQPRSGERVFNLLSEGIVNADGTPGRHFDRAYPYAADVSDGAVFQLSPKNKTLYSVLPAPLNGGPTDVCADNGVCTPADATSSEDGLASAFYPFLMTGGSGLTGKVPDSRPSPTTPTRRARCIASIRCGSRWTATPRTHRRVTRAAAGRTCSRGPK